MGLEALTYATDDHGKLLGLGDDDHPQYLKERASGGLDTEVPVHAHASGSGGTVDHGALTGLGDNDHPQYVLNDGEADDIINGTFSLTTDDFGEFAYLNITDETNGYKIDGDTVFTIIKPAGNPAANENLVFLGRETGNIGGFTSAQEIVALGSLAAASITSAGESLFAGNSTGRYVTTEVGNTFVGHRAGQGNVSQGAATRSTFVGHAAGQGAKNGVVHVVGIGEFAAASVTGAGSRGVYVGAYSGNNATTAANGIFIGYYSGEAVVTESDLLIIDSRDRNENLVTTSTHAILYGFMQDDPEDQTLDINVKQLSIGTDVEQDIAVIFKSSANVGLFTWKDTEDYFLYANDIAFANGEFLIFDKASGNGIKVDTTTPTFGWRDLLGETTTRSTGPNKPSFEAYNGEINQYRFSAGEHEHYDFHIPHDYVAETDIHLHIHWSQISATNTGGTVDFIYSAIYAKGHNQVSGSAFTSTPITATITSADAGTIRYQQHITEAIISGASATAALFDRDDLEPDGLILLTLEMDANNLTDSVGVTDPFIHFVDIHYQSTNIATKDKVPDFYT